MARLARDVTDRSLAGVGKLADWEARRDETRRRLLSALGLDPLPEKSPLDPRVTSSFEEEKFRVETLVFKALPGFYLTANLYLPKDGREKHPGILYVCGHSNGPLGAKVRYQHHPVWLASRGYAVLIVDPIQISEIEAIHHGTYRYGLWHWQALGYTPLGLETWCGVRSIDYLASRPEVDPEKIGMTGRSGGGTMTWFTMAIDERVKAGVTANATGIVATHVRNDTFRGHCDCAFFVNHPRIDYTDVAALCAPRAVLVQSGQKDWIYPPEGYRPLGEKSRKVWDLFGAPEKFREQDVDAEHKDLMEFRTEAFRWFERWLRGTETRDEVVEVPKIDVEKLRAVRGPLPADVRNASIAEEFPGPYVSSAPLTPDRERRLRRRLAEDVFGGDPPTPCELRPRTEGTRTIVQSEEGMPLALERLGPARGPRVLVAVGDGMDLKAAAMPVLRAIPRGEGWSPELAKFVRRSAPLVGRSLGTMQVYDVRRAIAAAKEICGAEKVVLYGRGEGAMLVLLASLGETAVPVERVLLESLPDSLLAEPILLNAARHTDVPELLALAVPRGLVFLGRHPLGYPRARQAAAALGNPALAVRAASLVEAIGELNR
jgi:dienelactone hydrolase